MTDVSAAQLLALLESTAGSAVEGSSPQKEITPAAGFCVKTRDEGGTKVFINMCSAPPLPLPPSWPSAAISSGTFPPDLTAYLTTHDLPPEAAQRAQKALSISFHFPPLREDVDHSGETCLVLDCLVNPEILAAASQFRPLKTFLITLALSEAEKKVLQCQLDPHFKLPKMKSKGDIPPVSLPSSTVAPFSLDSSIENLIGGVKKEKKEAPEIQLPGRSGVETTTTKKTTFGIQELNPSLSSSSSSPSSSSSQQDMMNTTATTATESECHKLHLLRHALKFEKSPAQAAALTVHIPLEIVNAAGLAENPHEVQIQVVLERVQVVVPGCAPLTVQLPLAVRTKMKSLIHNTTSGDVHTQSLLEGSTEFSSNSSKESIVSAVFLAEKGTLLVKLPFASFDEIAWTRKTL